MNLQDQMITGSLLQMPPEPHGDKMSVYVAGLVKVCFLLETQKLQQEETLATIQTELSRALLKQSDTLIQHQQAIGTLLTTQEAETRSKFTDIETRLTSSIEALEQHVTTVSQQTDYYVNSTQQAIQQQQRSIVGLVAILEYQSQAQEQIEQRVLQLTATLDEEQKHLQAELLAFKQLSLQSVQQIALLTEQTSQHESNQQQLTQFINIQQEHITLLEERLEKLNYDYVKL